MSEICDRGGAMHDLLSLYIKAQRAQETQLSLNMKYKCGAQQRMDKMAEYQ